MYACRGQCSGEARRRRSRLFEAPADLTGAEQSAVAIMARLPFEHRGQHALARRKAGQYVHDVHCRLFWARLFAASAALLRLRAGIPAEVGTRASTRNGLPLPCLILSGAAMTIAPVAGRRSRLVRHWRP